MAGTWKFLKNVAWSSGNTIDSGTFDGQEFVKVMSYTSGANIEPLLRLNSDSGSNQYTTRRSNDGTGSDQANATFFKANATGGDTANAVFTTATIKGISTERKLAIINQVAVDETGVASGDEPRRAYSAGVWFNSSDKITSVQIYNNSTGSFTSGDFISVWGASSDTVTDEKTTLTNVPANTRYEETDTRKIYRFGGINTSGLKALYNFDSSWSNNATDSDSITTGGDMTAQNNATFSTSVKKLGTASASFPADGDYAKTSTANGANFDFTGDSTVTLWVYRTDGLDSSYHAMVSKRSGGNSEYNLYLEPVSSGVSKPHLYITMGSSTFNGSATGAIPDSTWTHLATTIDGDVMKYYINGALDSTHDLNGAKGTLASQPFGVGAISGTGTEGYQGYLDQVSVWNRALSASEISTIYNSGTGKNIAGWIERNTA